jgi:hypothetical protein
VKQIAMSALSPNPYVLTIDGWFEAQRVSGRFDSDEFNQRRGRLCAALKRSVRDRRDEALVGLDHLALC